MGCCYENGIGVEADETMATQWFEKAAKQGNSMAQVLSVGTRKNRSIIKHQQAMQQAAEQRVIEQQLDLELLEEEQQEVILPEI